MWPAAWCPTAVGIWQGGDFVATSCWVASILSTARAKFATESMAPPFLAFSTFFIVATKVAYVLHRCGSYLSFGWGQMLHNRLG